MDAPAMTETLRDIKSLLDTNLVDPQSVPLLEKVAASYAVAISPEIARLIDKNDADDPIARQFVPSALELSRTDQERGDPIGDKAHSPLPGIVHRHADRVLFKPVHICPVYCRFCFRREMVGPAGDGTLSAAEIDAALTYIAAHTEVWEVILTGGDPFILSPRRIRDLSERIAAIPHVRIIRWHTRVPVVDPERVDGALVAALKVDEAATYVALHANHPREFSHGARRAIARLADAGIPLLSQSVLLRGVNDNVETLEQLMRSFVELRIKAYYLHHADLAPGTSHFRLPIEEGQALVEALRARVSGICMPSYVLDVPGGRAKVPLARANAEKTETGYRLRDQQGVWHDYPEEN
jgi:lysine 2,3-aminomutase